MGQANDDRRAGHDATAQATLLQLVTTSTQGQGGHDVCIQHMFDELARYFDLPLAIVSYIDGTRYEVEFVRDVDGAVEVGQTFELGQTYCDRVISLETPLFVDRASQSLFVNHPCYEAMALETYIGVRLFVDGQVYGTLNLTAPDPRPAPFTPAQIAVIETAGALISQHLALRASESRLDLAVRGSSVGLWFWDVRTGDLRWSPRFLDLVGIDDSTFRPTFDDFFAHLHPDDTDRVLDAVNNHLARKMPFDVEYRLRHASGRYVWVRARGQAEWGASGQAVRMAGSVDDITEHKAAETRAQDRLRMLEMAGEAAQIGYVDIDPVSGLGSASDEVFDILGLERARFELSLQNFLDRVVKADQREARRLVIRAVRSQQLVSQPLRFIRGTDGEARWVQLWIQALGPGDYRDVRFFGVIQDITPQRLTEERLREQAAELRRSNVELERFASIASHDLQEPLRKVSAFGGLIMRDYGDRLDERGRGMVETMVDAAQRMQVLIQDLLAYSRSAHVPLQLEPVALDALMADVRDDLGLALDEAAGELVWTEGASISGDSVLLRQLLVNLVGNAVKYRSQDRALRIAVTVEHGSDQTRLEVRDNGIGFAPEHAERIFEVFRRLHGRDAYPGTGVGLALCQRIVERHGGTIRADAAVDAGACFTVFLPADPIDRYSLMTGGAA